ncbi:hypothetical protein [Streptomyces mirabilis]|uniref:hypothetical protein n=1 Tax=Streptomyces mirabilis TaxID=68239 RepID=UPI0033F4F9D1
MNAPKVASREVEFLERLACGETPREIADAWRMELTSIWTVAERLRKKLGAKTNEQAVFIACELKILEPNRRHGDHAGFAAHRYRGEEPCDDCWAGERTYRAEQRQRRRQEAAGGPQALPRPPVQAREAREGPQAPVSRTNSPTTATAKQHPPERQRDAHPAESKESAA